MDQAQFFWSSVVDPGSVETSSTTNVSTSSMAATLCVDIAWDDLPTAIPYIVGYGTVTGPTGSIFTLSRNIPARHPIYPWLRATRMVSIQGRQPNGNTAAGEHGTAPAWKTARLTILFEAPKYPILTDDQISAEYQRYTEWSYEPSVETLARRGQNWYFTNGDAQDVTLSYAGDIYLRQPKGYLKATWYDVPDTWLYLGRLLPTNVIQCQGTVNLFAFPKIAVADQTYIPPPGQEQKYVQARPGTLLMLQPKIRSRAQFVPQQLDPLVDLAWFPRSHDVEFMWLHFDPVTDEATGVNVPGNEANNPVRIRGHNLVPLPRPSVTGYTWYAPCKGPATGFTPVDPIETDQSLQYQYTDHELIFSWARSQPTDP